MADDFEGGSAQFAMLENDRWIFDALVEGAPDYLTNADALLRSVRYFVRSYQNREDDAQLVRSRLVNHATNDLAELILNSLHGRGRSMLRSARSLFEVAVGSRDIPISAELAERYVLHETATAGLRHRLDRLDEYIESSPRSRRHARHRDTATSEQASSEGRRRWGKTWPTNWAGKSLRDRALNVGLETDYESFYRFASQPTHASAGGIYGTQRSIDGYNVVRYGPALLACPIALVYGLAYFGMTLEELGPRPESTPTFDALEAVRQEVRSYIAVVRGLDDALWPAEDFIPAYVTVASITPWKTSWYLHDPVLGQLIKAEPPTVMSDKQWANLADKEKLVRSSRREDFTEPLTIGHVDVSTVPKAGAEWIDDTLRLPRMPYFRPPGLPRDEVTSNVWCREVPREDVHHAQAVPQRVP